MLSVGWCVVNLDSSRDIVKEHKPAQTMGNFIFSERLKRRFRWLWGSLTVPLRSTIGSNRLKLNSDRTQFIWLGSRFQLQKMDITSIQFRDNIVQFHSMQCEWPWSCYRRFSLNKGLCPKNLQIVSLPTAAAANSCQFANLIRMICLNFIGAEPTLWNSQPTNIRDCSSLLLKRLKKKLKTFILARLNSG